VSTFRFEAIGTRWEIETSEPLGRMLQERVLDRIRQFDATYSRFRPDSLVSQARIAPAGSRFVFPDDCVPLFDLYDRLHAATAGAVDPLIGRDLELLGYDPTYSLYGWIFDSIQALGLKLTAVAVWALPVSVAWIALSAALGRTQGRRAALAPSPAPETDHAPSLRRAALRAPGNRS